jgi:peptidyl-prolyl cis-trans isomerase B (cyclophilin B)
LIRDQTIISTGYPAAMRRAIWIAWLFLAAFAIGGCGGGDDSAKSDSGCREASAPSPSNRKLAAPPQKVTPGEKLTAVVKTSCGTFDIVLDTSRAPKTTNSFAYLARKGFYDGLSFHRIVPGFVIQGGDPLGNGMGGPGYEVTERPPRSLQYTRGVVAMAKSGTEAPGTSGSQFFVVTGANVGLTPDYALVGKVSRGMNVVDRVGDLGSATGQPTQMVLIDRMTVNGD